MDTNCNMAEIQQVWQTTGWVGLDYGPRQKAFVRMCEYVCMCQAKWITSLVSASGLALIPPHLIQWIAIEYMIQSTAQ